MKNNKVVIMSIDGKKTVGYTSNGEFITLPKKEHHQVGQFINISELKPKRYFPGWQVATAVASIMLIALLGVFYPFFTPQAEAYLSLGLNTGGIELWVDKNNKVIDVNYYDSTKNWNNLKLTEKDVYETVTLLTSQAKSSGLIDEEQNLLMLNYANLTDNMTLHLNEHKLKQSVNQALNNDNNYLIIIGNHDNEFVNKAKELGVTASQYYVMEKSNAQGHHLSSEQIMHNNIEEVLAQSGTSPEEIFGMEQHKDVAEHQNPTNDRSIIKHPAPAPDTNMLEQEQNNKMPAHENNSENGMTQRTTSKTENHQEVGTDDNQYLTEKEASHSESKGGHK